MSPKGGIRPHSRFAVRAKRSEVLFVDYIAEHLNPQGRAGVIVPEGIIFTSQTAYKDLRKMLIENYLWAVVSLPAGVFQPYSGVKTSILLMDKNLAKKTDYIVFAKVENDGFDLGAQRRPNGKDDLPIILEYLAQYKTGLANNEIIDDIDLAHSVAKEEIAASGDYNLSGDRYRQFEHHANSAFPLVELGEVCNIISGQSPKGEYYNETGEGTPFYQGKTEFENISIGPPRKWTTQITRLADKDDILMSVRAPVGPVNIATEKICIGRGLAAIQPDIKKLKRLYLFYFLRNMQDNIRGNGGAVFDSISRDQIEVIKIPLPPLEVQERIVAEIEGYQRIIDGARQIAAQHQGLIFRGLMPDLSGLQVVFQV